MNTDSARVLQFCQGRIGRLTLPCEHILICLFWPRHMACGILVPWPGIKPGSRQWKCWILTTGLPWNSRKQKRGLWRRTLVGIQTLVLSCFFSKEEGAVFDSSPYCESSLVNRRCSHENRLYHSHVRFDSAVNYVRKEPGPGYPQCWHRWWQRYEDRSHLCGSFMGHGRGGVVRRLAAMAARLSG